MNKWKSKDGRVVLFNADCLKLLRKRKDNSIDAIVTDPPAGISFMGKEFDSDRGGRDKWIAWLQTIMEECLRVLKPGGHMLCWSLPRTSHWTATAIEDAGFEVRDCVYHIAGSGFPKSLSISKAIDKTAGAEREVVGSYTVGGTAAKGGRQGRASVAAEGESSIGLSRDLQITVPATDAAKQWDGWGTALKPSVENWILAHKPLDLSGYCDTITKTTRSALCQLPSCVKAAENRLPLNLKECVGDVGSALWGAVEKCNSPADLYALMDTLPSESEIPLSLSIGLSWLGILAAIYSEAKTYTTEITTALITDLKILNSLQSAITPATIIQAATGANGTESNAVTVVNCFNALNALLVYTRLHSALTIATDKVAISSPTPGKLPRGDSTTSRGISSDHWWLCRKPLSEKTIAENVLKHGVGGINVDGCRISHDGESPSQVRRKAAAKSGKAGMDMDSANRVKRGLPAFNKDLSQYTEGHESERLGRFPSHLLLSHAAGCRKRGVKKVKGHQGYPNGPKGNQFSVGKKPDGSRTESWAGHASPDGTETVDDWQCCDYCPVAELDRQSGERPSAGQYQNIVTAKEGGDGMFAGGRVSNAYANDSGGASRFFQTFDAGFLYQSKPSRAERNMGCEGLESKRQNSDTNIRTYNDRCATCGKKFVGSEDTICHCPSGEKITDKTVYKNPNNHPTVKSVALMQYLCRLITPPGGIVLDPFMGSGSTGIAAVKEGFRFAGIEMDEGYFEIAVKRINHELKKPKGFDLGI